MAKYYVCPICKAQVRVISSNEREVEAECYEHGMVTLETSQIFKDAPGQQNLFK